MPCWACSPETAEGMAATMTYLMVYLFMNIGAFAILMLLATPDAPCESIDDCKGLASRNPVAAALMLVFLFSLTGIPPTGGFIGKFYLLKAAFIAGYPLTVSRGPVQRHFRLLLPAGGALYVHGGSAANGHPSNFRPGCGPPLASACWVCLVWGCFPAHCSTGPCRRSRGCKQSPNQSRAITGGMRQPTKRSTKARSPHGFH
jgi:hypothetical protein